MDSKKFCSQCGSPVTEESKFCSSCGSVIKRQQPINILQKISSLFSEENNEFLEEVSADLIIPGKDYFGRYQLSALIRDMCSGKIYWTENNTLAGPALLDRKEINELETIIDSFNIDIDHIKSKQDRNLLMLKLKEWCDISELSIKVISNPINDGYVDRIEQKIDEILESIKIAYIYCFLENLTEEEIVDDEEYGGFMVFCEEHQKTLFQKQVQSLFNLGGFKLNQQECIILEILIFSLNETIFNEMILNYEDKKSDFFIKKIKSLSDGYNKYFSEENRRHTNYDVLIGGRLNVLLLTFNSKLLVIKIDENIW